MAKLSHKISFPRVMPPLCLVCGVDSGPIKTFLIVVMGGLALASVCFLLWAVGSKRIQSNEANASLSIEAENRKE